MKIIGSTLIISILLLMSLELKLTPYVNRVDVPIESVSSSVDTVVIYITNGIPEHEEFMKNLKYCSNLKTLFSGTYEHPLSLGDHPEYVFSKAVYSTYVGPKPGSYPTNVSLTISINVTLEKLKYVLGNFKKKNFEKDIYLMEIPSGFENGSIDDQDILINETFRIFPENRTTILKVTEDLENRKQYTLRLSTWGLGVVKLVGRRIWEPENIAVLISGLLNLPVPGNSIGRTPEELMNVSLASLAHTKAHNSIHLATVCVSSTISCCSFSPYISKPFLSKCDFKKYVEEIQSNLRNEEYEFVLSLTNYLEGMSLRCILYYKSLYTTFIVIIATIISLLWIYLLVLSFIVLEEITDYHNRTVMVFTVALHVVFYSLIVICAYTVYILSLPYWYIIYLALIVVLVWIALVRSSYIFNFVPKHVAPYVACLLTFYFAVNEIVYWSWETEMMLFAILVPYVTAEWLYEYYHCVKKNVLAVILLNLNLMLLYPVSIMQQYFISFGTHLLDLISISCWLLAGFPLVYRYRSNPFIYTPILLTQVMILYLAVIIGFQIERASYCTKVVSWWLLTVPIVVFCLSDSNSVRILLMGYSSSVPILLLSMGTESIAFLFLLVHMCSWYKTVTATKTDNIRKLSRGVSLYLYMFLCHLFTRGEVKVSRFLMKPQENWLLIQALKLYKKSLPILIMCFLWATLHKVQKQSFGKTVNYVLMLSVSISFRHFLSVVIDASKMEGLLNNYVFHMICFHCLIVTQALFKDSKVPFGYFIPVGPNKKVFVITKSVRHEIQKNNEHYNCLFI